jgi:CheY-like chemotaxis protein
VIYVEDNPVNVSVMQHIFRHLPGIGLLITEDAENCLIMIQQTRPDLVLMDINLPGMNGLEALRILKSDPETATIPVIAVSAAAMPRDVRAGLEAGFAGYLTKPFNVAALLSQVKTILQTNEPRQTVHRAIDQ